MLQFTFKFANGDGVRFGLDARLKAHLALRGDVRKKLVNAADIALKLDEGGVA